MKNMQIKPCPFCGGKAYSHKSNRFNWYVFCHECCISTDGMMLYGERPKSEQQAIDFWNTRNNSTQASELSESKKLDFGNHKCCKCGEDTNIPIEDPFDGKIEMCDMCRTCG